MIGRAGLFKDCLKPTACHLSAMKPGRYVKKRCWCNIPHRGAQETPLHQPVKVQTDHDKGNRPPVLHKHTHTLPLLCDKTMRFRSSIVTCYLPLPIDSYKLVYWKFKVKTLCMLAGLSPTQHWNCWLTFHMPMMTPGARHSRSTIRSVSMTCPLLERVPMSYWAICDRHPGL